MLEQREDMPRYAAYKDSGVEWLGEIPVHWDIRKLGFIGEFSASGIDKYINPNEPKVKIINFTDVCGNMTRILDSSFNFMEVTTTEFNRIRHLVKKGDLIFLPSSETYEDLGLSALVNEDIENTSYSYHLIRFRFQYEITHSFRKYLTNNNFVLNQFSRAGKGTTRKIIGRNIFKNILVLIPPFPEQTAIASFLDRKTAQIDQAVAIKQQQIALLKETKQILIQNAVTRGLDPNVPMRDSGVEWIGAIPAHWQINRGKYLFNEIDDRSISGEEELLSVSHMTGVTPRSEKNVTMFMAEDYTGSKTCQDGDLVFNIMWAWMGALGVADRIGIVSPSYAVFRQKTGTFNPQYLEFLLKTIGYIDHYNKVSTGLHISRLRFYSHMFFNMELGYPSKGEQDKIVAHIETQAAKIDQALVIQQQQIDKLKEYKATLINSAVTGKIRVTELI